MCTFDVGIVAMAHPRTARRLDRIQRAPSGFQRGPQAGIVVVRPESVWNRRRLALGWLDFFRARSRTVEAKGGLQNLERTRHGVSGSEPEWKVPVPERDLALGRFLSELCHRRDI
jgi:hypothetical protein